MNSVRLDHAAAAPPGDVLVRSARALDPRAGVDGPADLLIREGQVAELGAPGSLAAPDGAEVVEGEGLVAVPAFVDPHVHLRTPGREDEEDIDSGTRAAARPAAGPGGGRGRWGPGSGRGRTAWGSARRPRPTPSA